MEIYFRYLFPTMSICLNNTTSSQTKLIPLSIKDSFSNKTVFVIGATGFLGKVWLTQLLAQIGTFKKMYILIRGKGSQSGWDRFEQLINSSYVFSHLHEKYKDGLADYLREKVEIIEGDVSNENLGLSESQIEKLTQEVDITVNFAGLVDFNPELLEAFSINVQGAIHVAEFVQQCKYKKLVHISTCYVTGTREGHIEEKIICNQSPNATPLSIDSELAWIDTNVQKTLKEIESPEQLAELRNMIQSRNIELKKEPFTEKKLNKTVENMKRKKLRELLTQLGMVRAKGLGWTNTYTYTKGLAEIVLKEKYPDIELVIFRPSIVESSFSFPFAGWNEGFNTSGPLAYLMKSWFRHLPLKVGNPFDVIPVDYVARGLSIASAALLDGSHCEVYQCSSSDKNQLTIDKACEYTSQSHSVYFKEHGDDWREKMILSRWKTIPSRKDHPLSSQNLKPIFAGFERMFSSISKAPMIGKPTKPIYNWFLKLNRKLEQIDKLLELFYPFIHDYRHIFITNSLFLYDVKEPEFKFDIQKINWKEYWVNVQMPGLRRWCFPAIEARSVEKYKPEFPVSISSTHTNGNGKANGKIENGHFKTINPELQSSTLMRETDAETKKVIE